MIESSTVPVQSEHDEVVKHICEHNQERFTVRNNLETEKLYVSGLFPDIVLLDREGNLRFIIEVRKNGGIAQCIQQWKSAEPIPAFLYIVVPEGDLSNAKSIAQVVGLQQVKFGAYTIDKEQNKIQVRYE